MKKFLTIILSLAVSAVAVSAQDMAAATETYNNGATSLSMGDNESAMQYFLEALKMAEACGDEGADIVANCKDIIPKITLSIAKDLIKDEKYDEAVAKLQEAVKAGKDYQNAEVEKDAADLIPQVYLQKGNTLLNSKQFAEAAESYRKCVEIDSTNGMASLRLGMALASLGKVEEAENAYLAAMRNGQDKAAVKQLSTTYIKVAAAQLKAKNYEAAIASALKSNEYQENATAMKVAGTAAAQLKKNDDAIKYLEQYVALAPTARDLNSMYYTIAVLSQQGGDNEKACGYYQKITSDPQYGETAKQQIAAMKCNE